MVLNNFFTFRTLISNNLNGMFPHFILFMAVGAIENMSASLPSHLPEHDESWKGFLIACQRQRVSNLVATMETHLVLAFSFFGCSKKIQIWFSCPSWPEPFEVNKWKIIVRQVYWGKEPHLQGNCLINLSSWPWLLGTLPDDSNFWSSMAQKIPGQMINLD